MTEIIIIIRGRQGGKTTEMIRLAAEHQSYIVCPDRIRARQIWERAKDMGLTIPFPLTADEWQKHAYHPPGVRGLLFDDLDQIIQKMSGTVPVLAASWAADEDGETREIPIRRRDPAETVARLRAGGLPEDIIAEMTNGDGDG